MNFVPKVLIPELMEYNVLTTSILWIEECQRKAWYCSCASISSHLSLTNKFYIGLSSFNSSKQRNSGSHRESERPRAACRLLVAQVSWQSKPKDKTSRPCTQALTNATYEERKCNTMGTSKEKARQNGVFWIASSQDVWMNEWMNDHSIPVKVND